MRLVVTKMAQALAENALVGPITAEVAAMVCQPFIEELTASCDAVVTSIAALNKREPDIKFSLSDGMTVTVKFSGVPSQPHLAAFSKLFATMAEVYVPPPADF